MRTFFTVPFPSASTETIPPPAVPVTVRFVSSSCSSASFDCIWVACCIIFMMSIIGRGEG